MVGSLAGGDKLVEYSYRKMKDLFVILFLAGIAWLVWRAAVSRPTSKTKRNETPSKEDAQVRHLRGALEFAKDQHASLSQKKREQESWQQEHGMKRADELDALTGTEFEEFLVGLFRAQGYLAELTVTTGDYGADLILTKDGQRIAVQAKRYVGSVGVSAVQEALSGQAYYKCDAAWVVATGSFTANARELARKSGVKLVGRGEIGNLMTQNVTRPGRD